MHKFMESFYAVLSGIGMVAIPLITVISMFIGIPRLMDWYELNLSKDYLENRAERKVRDLKRQIRIIELKNEAVRLEKKLQGTDEK